MTQSADKDERAAALAAIAKAQTFVNDMCQGRRKWGMSIPANLENDPDIVIMDALVKAHNAIVRPECGTLPSEKLCAECGTRWTAPVSYCPQCGLDTKDGTHLISEQRFTRKDVEALCELAIAGDRKIREVVAARSGCGTTNAAADSTQPPKEASPVMGTPPAAAPAALSTSGALPCCYGGPMRQGCEESNCTYYRENNRG